MHEYTKKRIQVWKRCGSKLHVRLYGTVGIVIKFLIMKLDMWKEKRGPVIYSFFVVCACLTPSFTINDLKRHHLMIVSNKYPLKICFFTAKCLQIWDLVLPNHIKIGNVISKIFAAHKSISCLKINTFPFISCFFHVWQWIKIPLFFDFFFVNNWWMNVCILQKQEEKHE